MATIGGFQVGAFTLAFQQVTAPVTPVQAFSGGFVVAFEREMARRRKRLEEAEQAAEEAQALANKVDAEIATLLQEKIAEDAEREEIARIEALVKRHAWKQSVESERVQAALNRAAERLTFSTLQALEREVARMQEEEEMALLMVLAHFD